ncbi:MAG: NfeD family protein [Clostridia bacterium]|nr:NfeD family protein [Clostridia bacterium]
MVWIGLMIVFLIVEAITVSMVSIWFAGGSVAAWIAYALGAPFWVQILVFLFVTVVCVLLLRKAALRLVKPKEAKTNLDRIVGERVKILEVLENGDGLVKVNDVDWKVKAENGNPAAGDLVTICRVEGVKLVVKKEEE